MSEWLCGYVYNMIFLFVMYFCLDHFSCQSMRAWNMWKAAAGAKINISAQYSEDDDWETDADFVVSFYYVSKQISYSSLTIYSLSNVLHLIVSLFLK